MLSLALRHQVPPRVVPPTGSHAGPVHISRDSVFMVHCIKSSSRVSVFSLFLLPTLLFLAIASNIRRIYSACFAPYTCHSAPSRARAAHWEGRSTCTCATLPCACAQAPAHTLRQETRSLLVYMACGEPSCSVRCATRVRARLRSLRRVYLFCSYSLHLCAFTWFSLHFTRLQCSRAYTFSVTAILSVNTMYLLSQRLL